MSRTSLSLLPSLHRARLALLDSLTLVELSLPLSGHRNPVVVSSRFSFLLCNSCKGLAVFPGSEKHWYTLINRESLVRFMFSDRAQDSTDCFLVNRTLVYRSCLCKRESGDMSQWQLLTPAWHPWVKRTRFFISSQSLLFEF